MLAAGAGAAPLAPLGPQPDYAPGELIVRYKPGTAAAERSALNAAQGAHTRRGLRVPRAYLLRLPKDRDVHAAARAYERDPDVDYAEPNYIDRLALTPNDPEYNPPFRYTWNLHNTGQDLDFGTGPGTADADIDAPEAWNVTTGSSAVTVGVVDSGIDYNHPDLAGNIWLNPGESGSGKETNNIDDDGNGKVDDFRGWDFVTDDNDPMDDDNHGSHVAGIMGAVGNNGQGIPGINWNVRLAALRICDPNPLMGCLHSDQADAFAYAAQKGMQVVNGSFVGPDPGQIVADAIANAPDTLFVFPAGNGGSDGIADNNDVTPQYPCNYSAPNILCVAATEYHDAMAAFSNFGATSVDLAAPGEFVRSAFPDVVRFREGFDQSNFGTIWTTGGTNNTWARQCVAGSCFMTDSPAGLYANNTNSWSRNTAAINTTGYTNCRLQYTANHALADDQLSVARSTNTTSWTTSKTHSGSSAGWEWTNFDGTGVFDGLSALYFRWQLVTGASTTADGAQLDYITLRCRRSNYATGSAYQYFVGTSMASPHVAGAAALAFAKAPGAGVLGVKDAILNGVDKKAALNGITASGGRLNLFGMLTRLTCCHVRPVGGTPMITALVPASDPCTSPNRLHGPPDLPGGTDPDESCAPPAQRSTELTVGTPDAGGATAKSAGSLRFDAIVGNAGTPADEADVRLKFDITDVRVKTTGQPDYSGELEARTTIRVTDRRSGPSANEAATIQDIPFEFTVPCTTTASTTIGSTCEVTTTADAVQPGIVAESARQVWQLGQVQVADGGADGLAGTEPNTIFAVQGLFVP